MIERIGKVVGPKGFADFERDTVADRASLEQSRDEAAERFFQQADLPEIEDTDSGWTRDGIFWSKGIYWANPDGDSIRGSFGVQFRPDTAEIVGDWANYH